MTLSEIQPPPDMEQASLPHHEAAAMQRLRAEDRLHVRSWAPEAGLEVSDCTRQTQRMVSMIPGSAETTQ